MGETRNEYKILTGKPQRKRRRGRRRFRWEDNIRIGLREIGWGCVDWIHLAQNRDRWLVLVYMVINFRLP